MPFRLKRSTEVIAGNGLELRPWDRQLVQQMADWGERGFPYHPFDLGHLREPQRAGAELFLRGHTGPHRHYVATEDGRAVGRVSLNLEDPAGLYLWSVHVPPELEGRGVCRRMLGALMTSFERTLPDRSCVLVSNTFAEHAHRAYTALGFVVEETRWQFDRELAEGLWRVSEAKRMALADHVRFCNGRWEVLVNVFRRPPGAPMNVSSR